MKNRVLTFLMVLGMVGLLVGCSKLTKATVGSENVKKESKIVDETYKTDEGKDIVSFTAELTEFENNEKTQFVNDDIDALIEEMKEYYQGEFKDICEENIYYMPDDNMVFEAQLNSNVEFNQNGVISVTFNGTQYAGGAHGSNFHFASNYDVESKKKLGFSDVFNDVNKKEIIDVIAKYAKKMNSEFEEGWGFFPDYENYLDCVLEDDYFYFTDKNVVFIYNDSIIAPYAFGPIFLEVPYKDLKDYMIYNPLKK